MSNYYILMNLKRNIYKATNLLRYVNTIILNINYLDIDTINIPIVDIKILDNRDRVNLLILYNVEYTKVTKNLTRLLYQFQFCKNMDDFLSNKQKINDFSTILSLAYILDELANTLIYIDKPTFFIAKIKDIKRLIKSII